MPLDMRIERILGWIAYIMGFALIIGGFLGSA